MAATSCRNTIQTASTPISTSSPTATNRWRRCITGLMPKAKANRKSHYFHCDQIGIPREITDKNGKLLWFGEYDVWGKVTEETSVTGRRTSRSGFKTSIATIKRGCITISPGITTLMWVGLSAKTLLALREVIIYIVCI